MRRAAARRAATGPRRGAPPALGRGEDGTREQRRREGAGAACDRGRERGVIKAVMVDNCRGDAMASNRGGREHGREGEEGGTADPCHPGGWQGRHKEGLHRRSKDGGRGHARHKLPPRTTAGPTVSAEA